MMAVICQGYVPAMPLNESVVGLPPLSLYDAERDMLAIVFFVLRRQTG